MLFNSFHFLIFFPLVTALFYILPHKFRWLMLLIASCAFYMFFIPIYILILFITILIDYFAGIWIEKAVGNKRKLLLIIVSIISTCSVLFIFKYVNFFNNNARLLANILDWNYPIGILDIILPIGLSFHTFQSLSYVIEVYRGNQKAEYNFGIYSLYVMFYPQLVAGPIERPQNLLHQFYEYHKFDYSKVTNGLKLMAWGLFKKVVIADRLAVIVNQVYSNPTNYDGFPLIVATVFFAFQIFCDFSGYSDIAIGAAQVMGFKLMKNFDRPYFSKSISEFWSRWHISLSTWFRDYLYISLGGNRVLKWRWYYNLFITFLVSGLWHGAKWTFVIWGALHGFYLIFGIISLRYKNKISRIIGLDKLPLLQNLIMVITTFILVCFGWIFFRANNTRDAFYISTHLFYDLNKMFSLASLKIYVSGKYVFETFNVGRFEILVGVASIIFMEVVHFIQRKKSIIQLLSSQPVTIRWSAYILLIMSIILLSDTNQYQFIYFQF